MISSRGEQVIASILQERMAGISNGCRQKWLALKASQAGGVFIKFQNESQAAEQPGAEIIADRLAAYGDKYRHRSTV